MSHLSAVIQDLAFTWASNAIAEFLRKTSSQCNAKNFTPYFHRKGCAIPCCGGRTHSYITQMHTTQDTVRGQHSHPCATRPRGRVQIIRICSCLRTGKSECSHHRREIVCAVFVIYSRNVLDDVNVFSCELYDSPIRTSLNKCKLSCISLK